MVEVKRSNILIQQEDIVTRNANMHESSNIYNLEIMTNVNLKNRLNVKVKRLWTNKKILSIGLFMRNIKVLTLTVQKLLARLKF